MNEEEAVRILLKKESDSIKENMGNFVSYMILGIVSTLVALIYCDIYYKSHSIFSVLGFISFFILYNVNLQHRNNHSFEWKTFFSIITQCYALVKWDISGEINKLTKGSKIDSEILNDELKEQKDSEKVKADFGVTYILLFNTMVLFGFGPFYYELLKYLRGGGVSQVEFYALHVTTIMLVGVFLGQLISIGRMILFRKFESLQRIYRVSNKSFIRLK